MAFWRNTSLFSSSTPPTTTPNENVISQETVGSLMAAASFRTLLAGLIMSDTHRNASFYFDEFSVFLQIERLCDRLQLATRLEDRRDAVRALKGLSKVKDNSEENFVRLKHSIRNVNSKWVHRA